MRVTPLVLGFVLGSLWCIRLDAYGKVFEVGVGGFRFHVGRAADDFPWGYAVLRGV